MIPTITLAQLSERNRRGQLIDVRSPSEFAAGHIPGATNIPMDQIEGRLDDLPPDSPLILVCQKGQRAEMTAHLLAPCKREIAVLQGGTDAWIEAGRPVVTNAKTRWSLERQVRCAAGLLVIVSLVLSRWVAPLWILLAVLVGLGLILAGLTDLCPMAIFLQYMPWNRTPHCVAAGSAAQLARGR